MTSITYRVELGDVREALRRLPAESVQCVVTSPPYWGLRDYGVAGQLGLEATPEAFVSAMVEVFREVRRVLRSDGTLWLNLGDSYATGAGTARSPSGSLGKNAQVVSERGFPVSQPNRGPVAGLKPKDLVGIPWRVAFALQADGWWLRSDVVWAKPNAMPESVTDRPTRSHEYVFLLTAGEQYFYDADAVREPHADPRANKNGRGGKNAMRGQAELRPRGNAQTLERYYNPLGRNLRTVWSLATQPFREAHFATFPEELVRPCILAGSRPGDLVLDPFSGSGTTGVVALKQGRSYVGTELNPAYREMSLRRLERVAPLLAREEVRGVA